MDNRIKWKSSDIVDQLKLSDAQLEKLRAESLARAIVWLKFASKIVSKGGNIHRVNFKETARRRAANKRARTQRRVNCG